MKTNTAFLAALLIVMAASVSAAENDGRSTITGQAVPAGSITTSVHANFAGALTSTGNVDGTVQLTGDLYADLAGTQVQDSARTQSGMMYSATRKHPILAGFMSLAVPGAGEVYVGEYTKGAICFAIEAVGITIGILQNNKGDKRTNEFQDYANAHWSAVKYAEYLNTYAAKYRANKDVAHIAIDPNTSLPPWERVDFNAINAYEAEGFSIGFSHKLPKYNEQQYYELIGKYNQFKYGWDTYPVQANGFPADDSGYNEDIPQQLKDYAAVRGTANDFYSASRLAFSIVVINHILSAVDAFLSAHHYNTVISSHMSMDVQRYGDRIVTVPQLSVSVGL